MLLVAHSLHLKEVKRKKNKEIGNKITKARRPETEHKYCGLNSLSRVVQTKFLFSVPNACQLSASAGYNPSAMEVAWGDRGTEGMN